jgi:hypothetical protein
MPNLDVRWFGETGSEWRAVKVGRSSIPDIAALAEIARPPAASATVAPARVAIWALAGGGIIVSSVAAEYQLAGRCCRTIEADLSRRYDPVQLSGGFSSHPS